VALIGYQLVIQEASALASELGVRPVTLYRYIDANGNLRGHGKRVLSAA
jgi:hypothetical protein